jgi:hypothetical protein
MTNNYTTNNNAAANNQATNNQENQRPDPETLNLIQELLQRLDNVQEQN